MLVVDALDVVEATKTGQRDAPGSSSLFVIVMELRCCPVFLAKWPRASAPTPRGMAWRTVSVYLGYPPDISLRKRRSASSGGAG